MNETRHSKKVLPISEMFPAVAVKEDTGVVTRPAQGVSNYYRESDWKMSPPATHTHERRRASHTETLTGLCA